MNTFRKIFKISFLVLLAVFLLPSNTAMSQTVLYESPKVDSGSGFVYKITATQSEKDRIKIKVSVSDGVEKISSISLGEYLGSSIDNTALYGSAFKISGNEWLFNWNIKDVPEGKHRMYLIFGINKNVTTVGESSLLSSTNRIITDEFILNVRKTVAESTSVETNVNTQKEIQINTENNNTTIVDDTTSVEKNTIEETHEKQVQEENIIDKSADDETHTIKQNTNIGDLAHEDIEKDVNESDDDKELSHDELSKDDSTREIDLIREDINKNLDDLRHKIIKEIDESDLDEETESDIKNEINAINDEIENEIKHTIKAIKVQTLLGSDTKFVKEDLIKRVNNKLDKIKEIKKITEKESIDDSYIDDLKLKIPNDIEIYEKRIKEDKSLIQERDELYKDTDGDGIADYYEKNIYETDWADKDTDDDGVIDGEEIISGTDPVSIENKKIIYEDAQKNKSETDVFSVESIEVIEKEKVDNTEKIKKIKFTGKALPNSFVTLYIYSSPIVVTVKADSNGKWEYVFDKELEDGTHKVYVATVDRTGRVLAKSKPFPFVKQAAAIEVSNLETPQEKPSIISPIFIYSGIVVVIVMVFATFVIIGHYNRRKEEEMASIINGKIDGIDTD